MAYNVPNFGSIGANAGPFPVGYIINGGQNKGAQFAQGNPQSPGADLISTNHEIDLMANGQTIYAFQIKNRGGKPTSWTLAGGGLS